MGLLGACCGAPAPASPGGESAQSAQQRVARLAQQLADAQLEALAAKAALAAAQAAAAQAEGGGGIKAVRGRADAATEMPAPSRIPAGRGRPAGGGGDAEPEPLAQQLRVAEAFRASLEAALRDARFANSALQTQVLGLQTKLEAVVEAQVAELEKLNRVRADNADSHDAAVRQAAALRQQLAAAQSDAAAAAKGADAAARAQRDAEQRAAQLESELSGARAELAAAMLEVARADSHTGEVLQQAAAAQGAAAAAEERARAAAAEHAQAVQRLEAEVRGQRSIYDATVQEFLALSAQHAQLKQAHAQMVSDAAHHGNVVALLQQELADLSYYAAAGRAALGVAPPAKLRSFSQSEGGGAGAALTAEAEPAAASGAGVAESRWQVADTADEPEAAPVRELAEPAAAGELELMTAEREAEEVPPLPE
ncbi:hypothetical protein HT031_000690 [Scenedesmus sp. PABB004]|nr:hypothetical protein HT031_000690 [Scenedesmus sp. PABB004]